MSYGLAYCPGCGWTSKKNFTHADVPAHCPLCDLHGLGFFHSEEVRGLVRMAQGRVRPLPFWLLEAYDHENKHGEPVGGDGDA